MTQDERRALARALAALDLPHPLLDPRLRRRRTLAMLVTMACCVALAGWIAILILTLPGRYTSSDWRAVWVGLDIAELLGFAATAWAAWHQRQVVIFFMIMTGTLLLCDAWFDLALSYGSSGFTASLLSALLAEVPLALVMFAAARRLVRLTVQTGIWKPAGFDAALTIRTTYTPANQPPPYADSVEGRVVHYKYRGTDPNHAECIKFFSPISEYRCT